MEPLSLRASGAGVAVTNIPESDVIHTMTDEMRRLFISNGCAPTCHSCRKPINAGDGYALKTLASYRSKDGTDHTSDMMVCQECKKQPSTKEQIRYARQQLRERHDPQARRGATAGCFIVDGVILPGEEW